MKLSDHIKATYDDQYKTTSIAWRNITARNKALNIQELSKHIQFQNVLEVGAGEGSILQWLSKWDFCKDLNCVEISESGIAEIKNKNIPNLHEITLFDGYHLPFQDQQFDLVICSHVMEHVEHERLLLREIRRVSKYQIFEVPIDFSFYVDRKINHFMSYGHINIYTPALFRFLLQTESLNKISDRCILYDEAVWEIIYKDNPQGWWLNKFKRFVLNTFPYLKGIKPNSYAILTEQTEKTVTIF